MNKIIYNDFAANAEKNVIVPASGSSDYQKCNELLSENDRVILNYASFEKEGIDLLDETLYLAEENDNIGYISSGISDISKSISNTLVISLSNGYYSAPGITFYFYKDYCDKMAITWLKDDKEESKIEVDVSPKPTTESKILEFYYENKVESFNKIKIEFKHTYYPNQFIKLAGIDLGVKREITEFHSNIEIFTEIDIDCADVPGSTCDFAAEIKDFKPSQAQSFYVYGKNKLFGKFYVDNIISLGNNRYSFECSDAIMQLEKSTVLALSQGNYSVSSLVKKIHDSSNLSINANGYADSQLTGFIQEDTCRYAAAMLSFGTGCFLTGFAEKMLTLKKPCNKRNKIISASQILGRAEYCEKSQYSQIVLKCFSENFDTIKSVNTAVNKNKKSTDSAEHKIFDQYSLIINENNRFNELIESGFGRNEITARIELQDESLGDILTVETPYDGLRIGIIKSMHIILGYNKITSTLTMIERGFSPKGSDE